VKCRRCAAPAIIELRRHNAAFCSTCFVNHCHEQTRRAIHDYRMLEPGQRVLVAVSGGKDSLALWHLLHELGYRADGLYLGLGIAEYSDESAARVRDFAARFGFQLHEIDLPTDVGFDIPGGARVARRAPCSACGLSKRHLFNQAALRLGYPAIATGHNLDDEAAVLLGNTLRWDEAYLARQYPVLPESSGFARKVKPLVRLGEREMAAYCVVHRIDYILDECPMAAGNRHLHYKELLNSLEASSPGAKAAFLFNFLDRARGRFADVVLEERAALAACAVCGAPTPGDVCAFCRLQERASGSSGEPVILRSRTP
jgi:uncharacterized protein (TIGR00269 family)